MQTHNDPGRWNVSASQTRPSKAHDEAGLTRPSRVQDDLGLTRARPAVPPPFGPPGAPTPRRQPWPWRWIISLGLFLGLVLLIAILSGYQSGQQFRDRVSFNENRRLAQEQFDLGVEDLLAARYELAQQRFEYVLSLDPNYPGAVELLDQALLALNRPTVTPSPPVTPTDEPEPSPTISLDSLDGLLNGARGAVAGEDWNLAMNLLITLRGESPDYQRAEVNQLMFTALRNRGLQKIFAGNQEQGIYDLTLASRLGSLDNQAASWRQTAAFYMFASSYYGLDWALSAQYFSQLCASGVWSSCAYYAHSAREVGRLLVDEDPCAAIIQFQNSLTTLNDPALAPTATEAAYLCQTATAPLPTETITITPTITDIFVTSETPGPSVTPSPSSSPGGDGTPEATPTETSRPMPSATNTPG